MQYLVRELSENILKKLQPNKVIIISGSSSFDIHQNTGEPLTGRKYSFNLYAFSEREYGQIENKISKINKVKGSYSETILNCFTYRIGKIKLIT